MNINNKPEPSTEDTTPKTYNTPTLTEYGTITELTLGTSGGAFDAGTATPSNFGN